MCAQKHTHTHLSKRGSTGRLQLLFPAEVQVVCVEDAPRQTHTFTHDVVLLQPAEKQTCPQFKARTGNSDVPQMSSDLPLQSELRLLLLVFDDLTDGLPGRGDQALFDAQVRVEVHQVLVLLGGRRLVTVLSF